MAKRTYPISKPSVTDLEIEYVTDAVKGGWVSSLGEYVTGFERGFARFCEVEHAISVSNGTVAIHLALVSARIGSGDEVIVPDLSFIASANAVLAAGATPVFADIDPETLCIDAGKLEQLITPRTKAIMAVHLYGHPADMDAIRAIAARYNLFVIEDAAEAHGAEYKGKRVGGLGDCATFSFYGNKALTTGEGGMITTNDANFAERCRFLRDHAMDPEVRYWHVEPGFNYRITNLQAALGCAQISRSDELAEGRLEIFRHYQKLLADLHGVRLNRTARWAKNSYWLVCAEIEGLTEKARDVLMHDLRQRGVDTRPYFYPMSRMPYFKEADTPVAHAISPTGISLPTYIGLSANDIEYISAQFEACVSVIQGQT